MIQFIRNIQLGRRKRMEQKFQAELDRQLALDREQMEKSRAYFEEQVRKSKEFMETMKQRLEVADGNRALMADSIKSAVSYGEPDPMPSIYDDTLIEDMPTLPVAPVAEKPTSLWALQDQLAKAEEEVNSADDAGLAAIVGDIRNKVDSIKGMIDIFDSEASRFKAYKDEMAKRQKSLENAAQRLRDYTISALRYHGTEFEVGNMWAARIQQSEKLEVFKDAPEPADYVKLGLNFPVIKQSLVWDKTEMKKLIKSGNQDLLAYAKIVKSDNLNFKPVNSAKRG